MPSVPAPYSIILPHLILACGIVATLLVAAFSRGSRSPFFAALTTLCLALLSLGRIRQLLPANCTDLLFLDRMSLFTIGLVLFASLSIVFLAYSYLQQQEGRNAEFFVLLLLGTLGGLILASTSHFLSLFLGIELIGIPLAAMAAYLRDRARSIEAGFKYIILSGLSSAILLFGIALLYAETGSLLFGPAIALSAHPAESGFLIPLGLTLVLSAMGFKLALVPFHFWSPDVYEGAPAPVAIFAATVSKTAAIIALMRIFPPAVISHDQYLFGLFAGLSLASMILGTLLAVRQRNIKRLLAYSSIAHNGYLLIAFLAVGPLAYSAILLYLAFSVATNLASFGVVTVLSARDGDAEDLSDYAGLTWRKPMVAAVFTTALLSLLGIPLTAGFIAKFYLVAAGMESMRLPLVLTLTASTAVSAFYYIRVVMTMFLSKADIHVDAVRHSEHRVSSADVAVIIVQAALILAMGIAPQKLIGLIERMIL